MLILILHFSKLHILFRYSYIARCIVKIHCAQITWRSINDSLLLVKCPSFSFYWGCWLSLLIYLVILLIFFLNIILKISFCLWFSLYFSLYFFILWAWIINRSNRFDHIVSNSNNVYFSINPITTSPYISIKTYINIIIFCVGFVLICLPSISKYKWMVWSPWYLDWL